VVSAVAEEELEKARAAKEKLKRLLSGVPEVSGIGITRLGEAYALKVNLACDLGDPALIPEEVNGLRVLKHVTGRITRQD